MEESDSIAPIMALVIGLLAIAGVFLGLAGTNSQRYEHCMPVCVIDGAQYQPQVVKGECWCNLKKARALTSAP